MEYLQPASFQAPPLARRSNNNSNFNNSNSNTENGYPIHRFPERVSSRKFVRCMPPKALDLGHPVQSSNFADYEGGGETPTPRAAPASSVYSPTSSIPGWRRDSTASTDYADDNDSSYESSDSEIVPLQVSNSIKKVLKSPRTPRTPRTPRYGHERLSSLVIPSPSAWPTIQKLQQQQQQKTSQSNQMAIRPISAPKTPLSPAALAKLSAHATLVPAKSETPSLDGSLTSEEVATMSCPSTPHTQNTGDEDKDWDIPFQLHPDALDTLLQLSSDFPQSELETISEVPERIDSCPISTSPEMEDRGLDIGLAIPMTPDGGAEDYEPLSAISLPSPGGFFSSLSNTAQSVWADPPRSDRAPPPTSIAETFYGIPQERHSSLPRNRSVDYAPTSTDGPPTARRDTFTSVEEVDEIYLDEDNVEFEYDESYEQKLHEDATSNLNRTSLWITAQETYLSALATANPVNEPSPRVESVISPLTSPSTESVARSTFASPRKSVRFAKQEPEVLSTAAESSKPPVPSDALVYHAFQHLLKKSHAADAYLHRQTRAEAIQSQRAYLPESHRAQLLGKFTIDKMAPALIKKSEKPSLPDAPDELQMQQEQEAISRADTERQALQQLSLSIWNMEASKLVSGGSLLPKQATNLIKTVAKSGRPARILNLGGQPTADWGWAVALEHTEASVFTAVVAAASSPSSSSCAEVDWTIHRGPSNHRTIKVPNPWTLPFASSTFDIVSARTLHTLLHASSTAAPTRDGGDEFDATLAEIMRVLAPGGLVHFGVLDAEVAAPASTALAARSVEFAVSLRSRGYDPCATRSFLSKLSKAGFTGVQRTWIDLSLGGQADETIERATSIVGALAWEKWMLKLQLEMGRPEARLLDGVAKALDEARAHATETGETSCWRMLVGCARKP